MHSLDTIKYLNEQRAAEQKKLAREPIKVRPDEDSIRNPTQADTAWECEIETECYENDGFWMSTLRDELKEATPAQRAWLEQTILETALQPALVRSGRQAENTRLDVTFVRGDQHRDSSWKNLATWKLRLRDKKTAEAKHPATQRVVVNYDSEILQPRIHDLLARMLVRQLTEECRRTVPTNGTVSTWTVPMSVWLLFTRGERENILRSLNLEHASLTDLVAAFFYDPTMDANVYRSRTKEPHIAGNKLEAGSNLDAGSNFTMWHVEWPQSGVPKISKCASTLGSGLGLQGGRNLLLREKTR